MTRNNQPGVFLLHNLGWHTKNISYTEKRKPKGPHFKNLRGKHCLRGSDQFQPSIKSRPFSSIASTRAHQPTISEELLSKPAMNSCKSLVTAPTIPDNHWISFHIVGCSSLIFGWLIDYTVYNILSTVVPPHMEARNELWAPAKPQPITGATSKSFETLSAFRSNSSALCASTVPHNSHQSDDQPSQAPHLST